MELRVQMKGCESCGCLWFRMQSEENVYCRKCEVTLRDFPLPESRKRPGRQMSAPLADVWGMAEAAGGAN